MDERLAEAWALLPERLGSHVLLSAAALALAVLKAGRIVADGAPRALMAGHDDPDVARMMSMPARQAERVRRIMQGRPHG